MEVWESLCKCLFIFIHGKGDFPVERINWHRQGGQDPINKTASVKLCFIEPVFMDFYGLMGAKQHVVNTTLTYFIPTKTVKKV